MTETSQSTAPDPIHTFAQLVAFVFVAGDVVALLILTVEILYPLAVAFPDVDLATLGGTALVVGILGLFQFVIASIVMALLEL